MAEDSRPATPMPGSARIVGVLNSLFGVAGALWNPTLLALLLLLTTFDPGDPWSVRVLTDRNYRAFLFAMTASSTVACVVQVASGSGLRRGKPWGWSLGVVYSIYSLVAPIAEFVIDYAMSTHAEILEARRAKDDAALWSQLSEGVIFLLYNLTTMIYPAILLFVLTRRDVRRYYGKR